MIVLADVDGQLETHGSDEGSYLNTSASAVILSLPTGEDLKDLWGQFRQELKDHLLYLWSMPHDEVVKRFGLLGYSSNSNKLRGNNAWGLMPRAFAATKGLVRIQQQPAVKAIAAAGLVTAANSRTQRFRRPEGLADFLNSLPLAKQQHFLRTLLSPNESLEEVLRLSPGCTLGESWIEARLKEQPAVEAFLQELATKAASDAQLPVSSRSRQTAQRQYAAIWFAAYLAREGVWLLPLEFARHASKSFPQWMRPIQVWLSIPPTMREFCDRLMLDHLARKDAKTQDALVVSVATELAWSSTAWHAGAPSAGPLIGYKRYYLEEERKSEHRSWAANRLWDAQLTYYSISPDQHPDSHAFVLGKRLVTKGVRPFDWIRSPNRKNLKGYLRIYESPPAAFPQWLIDWADVLECLLPLFRVENIDLKIKPLNLWLLYLAGLSDPPRSFEEVSRARHINSGGTPGGACFHQFLAAHYPGSRSAHVTSAMSTLRQAWALASVQFGFASRLANPIDPGDSPAEYRARGARTSRTAMDARVAEIIARENMRDDMAFARSLGTKHKACWRDVRCPDTGELISVFFPAAPSIIHVILHSGMRGSQARWLDTGEGDEQTIDFEELRAIPNVHQTAQVGRREGFLRLCDTVGQTREQVIGMWVNSGKSGPHEVPWIHGDVIPVVRALIGFQSRYYPIVKPVAIERDLSFDSRLKKKKGDAFPLMRDPINRLGQPITMERVRSYWIALLEHCQPIVDAQLGYRYPLIGADGNPNFDIHSLRVTLITTLLENGVPVTVVQMLVGHKSPIMTWYYQDVTNYKIHSALQSLLQRRKQGLKSPTNLSLEEEESLTSDVITFRSEEDFEGAEMLKAHRATGAAVDVFSHGICPGGKCEAGGSRIAEGRYRPVWRPRACSSCRFRVTGPAFLNGLVQRANTLVWEIKGSMRKEAELNLQIEEDEDAGRPVEHLRSTLRQEQGLRDLLFNEWCLEIRTIHRAEAAMKEAAAGAEADAAHALTVSQDARQMSTRFREVHDFELAQRLAHDALLTEANLDLPADVLLYRDQVLHRIAHANKISDYFYALEPRLAREALSLFGEALVTHTSSPEELQQVIDGSLLLREVPGLGQALSALPQSAPAVRGMGELIA